MFNTLQLGKGTSQQYGFSYIGTYTKSVCIYMYKFMSCNKAALIKKKLHNARMNPEVCCPSAINFHLVVTKGYQKIFLNFLKKLIFLSHNTASVNFKEFRYISRYIMYVCLSTVPHITMCIYAWTTCIYASVHENAMATPAVSNPFIKQKKNSIHRKRYLKDLFTHNFTWLQNIVLW